MGVRPKAEDYRSVTGTPCKKLPGRRQKRAEKHNATAAALRKAEEARVDIDDVEGTGAEGRVTVHDVEKAMSK